MKSTLAVAFFALFSACTKDPPMPDPVYVDRTDHYLREYAKSQKPKIQGCIDRFQRDNPKAEGELQVVNIIEADGKISDKFVKENTVEEAKSLEECVLEVMKDWEYPRVGKPQRLVLKYAVKKD